MGMGSCVSQCVRTAEEQGGMCSLAGSRLERETPVFV